MLSLVADICLDWNATITLKVGASAGVRCPAGACPLAQASGWLPRVPSLRGRAVLLSLCSQQSAYLTATVHMMEA